jgi:hypothetical protein
MQKIIAILLISIFAVSCAGSQRGCGCPNNLGMIPMQHEMELPVANYVPLATTELWN